MRASTFYRYLFVKILYLVLGSIISTMISELAFTFYIGVYDFSNLLGHLFKIIAFYLIYVGIIQQGLRNPVDLLFRKIKTREKDLERINVDLQHEIKQKNLAEMNLRQFVATVSRELRTPISALVQSTDNLKKYKNKMDEDQRDKL